MIFRKNQTSLSISMEHKGIKYEYKYGDIDPVIIRPMIDTLVRYRSDEQQYPNDLYYAGQVSATIKSIKNVRIFKNSGRIIEVTTFR